MYYKNHAAAPGSDLSAERIVLHFGAVLILLVFLVSMLPTARAEDVTGVAGSGAMPRTASAEESSYWEPQYEVIAQGEHHLNYSDSVSGPMSGLKLYFLSGLDPIIDSFNITSCGKNLVNPDYIFQHKSNLFFCYSRGEYLNDHFLILVPGYTYVLSFNNPTVPASGLYLHYYFDRNFTSRFTAVNYDKFSLVFSPSALSFSYLDAYWYSSRPTDTTLFQVEVGSTFTEFEPYIGNTISISLPFSLYGFKVPKNGNYIDTSGQSWLSDVANFDDGNITRYCGYIESYNGESITGPYLSSTGSLTTGAQVVYALDRPVTEPIPDDVLEEYHSLLFYDGVTNIIAEGCGIEVCKLLPTPDESLGSSISDNFNQSLSDVTGSLDGWENKIDELTGNDFIPFVSHIMTSFIPDEIWLYLLFLFVIAIILAVYRFLKE